MFTGALAASHYGRPRTTMDVDVIISVEKENTETGLVTTLRNAGLQINVKKVDAAIKSGFRIVMLKDSKTPFTVDIILSEKRLEKKAGTILDLQTFYQKPEDLILAKLRMIKATVPKERALKDKDDVKAILEFTEVNLNVIKRQAKKGKTLPILKSIIDDSTHKKQLC
jgi:hypothetical protein